MKSRISFGAVAVLLPALLIALPAAPTRAGWFTYQGNERHDGYAPGRADMSSASLRWQATISQSTTSMGFALGNNTLLISEATLSDNVFRVLHATALDQTTGALLWRKDYPGYSSLTGPAYANGVAYIQANDGSGSGQNYVQGFDVRTGTPIFQTPYQSQWQRYLSPTPYDGQLYTGGGTFSGVFDYNAATGVPRWFTNVPQDDTYTPSIDGNYAYIYHEGGPQGGGQLTVLDRQNGSIVGSLFDADFASRLSAFTEAGAVALGSLHDGFSINGGRLLAWDLTSSNSPTLAWSKTGGYSGQATVANGRVYALYNGTLNVLDEATGALLWNWSQPGVNLVGKMIATDNLLFVGGGASSSPTGSETLAIDLVSHMAVWSFPIRGELALTDGTLFIGGTNRVVYAINVPEPSTLALLALGLFGCLATASKKRRAS